MDDSGLNEDAKTTNIAVSKNYVVFLTTRAKWGALFGRKTSLSETTTMVAEDFQT